MLPMHSCAQTPLTQSWLAAQSALVVQETIVVTQAPSWHFSPKVQSASMVQLAVQLPATHFSPLLQSLLLVQRTGWHVLLRQYSLGAQSLVVVQLVGAVPQVHTPLEAQ